MPNDLNESDLDAIREVRAQRGYTLIFKRTTEVSKLDIEKLVRGDGEADYLRGRIAGLRLSLEIPEILETEARQNVEVKRGK